MKDIGSIFPLSMEDISLNDTLSYESIHADKRINYSLCREALWAIVHKYELTNKTVLLPAYTCQTVIDPFIQQGWTCYYFGINLDLRIDIDDLFHKCKDFKPAILLVHPYYGMELNDVELDALERIKYNGTIIIEDITQSIYSYSRPLIFDYFIGSYRKWYKIPDGGFLESNNFDGIEAPEVGNNLFVNKQIDAMYLRAVYFETGDEFIKSISIKLNKEAVAETNRTIKCHKMSDFSAKGIERENQNEAIIRRLQNYTFLYNNIHQSKHIKFVCKDINEVTTAPLYFPIYVSNRAEIQKTLALKHIYAPVLWPVHSEAVLINDNIKYIYSHILMLPIDQRYDTDDMMRVVEIINDYE